MATNKYKEIPVEQEPEVIESAGLSAEEKVEEKPARAEEKPRKPKRTRNFFQFISFFDFADKNRIVHAMPFVLFLTVIALIYITNSFYAEKTIRDIDRTKKELKEMRAEFISTKSKFMINSMQSQVAQHASAAAFEIKESTVPPKKIVVEAEKSK